MEGVPPPPASAAVSPPPSAPAAPAPPPPFALVPPPVVTRSGRISKPVKDAYVEKNKRAITRLIVHDAKQSMLDDIHSWRHGAVGKEPAHAGLHWPVINVHDTYATVLAEYTRVHVALFGAPPAAGDEGVPDGFDDDESYVEGDSQRGGDSEAEVEEEEEEEDDDEEEEEEEESDDEEASIEEEEEEEEEEDKFRTPVRAGQRRARSGTIVGEAEGGDDSACGPLPVPSAPKRPRAGSAPETNEKNGELHGDAPHVAGGGQQ
jgi:hypothetical protein